MVNLIAVRDLVKYDVNLHVNVLIEREVKNLSSDFVHMKELAPTELIENMWENSLKTDDDYTKFKELYKLQLQTGPAKTALLTIVELEKIFDVVNLITYESRSDRSHRKFLVDSFDDLQIQVHLS